MARALDCHTPLLLLFFPHGRRLRLQMLLWISVALMIFDGKFKFLNGSWVFDQLILILLSFAIYEFLGIFDVYLHYVVFRSIAFVLSSIFRRFLLVGDLDISVFLLALLDEPDGSPFFSSCIKLILW